MEALFFLPGKMVCRQVADDGCGKFFIIKQSIKPKNLIKGRFLAFLLAIHADVSFLCRIIVILTFINVTFLIH